MQVVAAACLLPLLSLRSQMHAMVDVGVGETQPTQPSDNDALDRWRGLPLGTKAAAGSRSPAPSDSRVAAASKGDAAAAQAAVKQFVALGQIEELDMKPGSYFNAKSPCDRAGLQCGYQYEGYLGSRNDADLEKAARVAESLRAANNNK